MCQCSTYVSRFKWPTERSCKEESLTGSNVKAALRDSPIDWLQSFTSAIARQSLWWSSSGCFLTSILSFLTVTTRDFLRVLHDAHAYCDTFFLRNLYENLIYLSPLIIMNSLSDYSLSEIYFQRKLKIDRVSWTSTFTNQLMVEQRGLVVSWKGV